MIVFKADGPPLVSAPLHVSLSIPLTEGTDRHHINEVINSPGASQYLLFLTLQLLCLFGTFLLYRYFTAS